MKLKIYPLIILIVTLASCSIKPAKIEYGKDSCHFCKMNIVEKTHASQLVTKKGKTYKYDAIECLLNDLKDKDQSKIGLVLVTNYSNPEELIDATQATYLISDSVQSPMGANLSGFQLKEDAIHIVQSNNNGKVYNWPEIQKLFYND